MTVGPVAVNDVNSGEGLKAFDLFIKERSYVEGYSPSQVDVAVFELFKKPVNNAKDLPNATRWYNHIKYFADKERSSWPGVKKLPSNISTSASTAASPAAKKEAPPAEDDDVDLFGSEEEEDDEAAKIREERLKAYADKKSKKPALIAKSSIVLDVKPWDDETNMADLEKQVRTIQMDGLVWGASKLVPLAYSIKKLQIMCVVEDDKVSVDELVEKIQEFEDFVQSVDIAAFNKI